MDWLQQLIEARAAAEGVQIHILNSRANEKKLTYHGIDVCGDRLVAAIQLTAESLAEEGRPVTRLSLIGYSLGGLMQRYVAGRLSSLGWFGPAAVKGSVKDGGHSSLSTAFCPASPVEPVNWVSIVAPHLGVWRPPSSWYIRLFNRWVPVVCARSGVQLLLQDQHADGRPLLINLCDPALPFLPALAAFRKRTLLANAYLDRSVPYPTASISLDDVYAAPGVTAAPISSQYPSIIRPVRSHPTSAPPPQSKSANRTDLHMQPNTVTQPQHAAEPGATKQQAYLAAQPSRAEPNAGALMLSDAATVPAADFVPELLDTVPQRPRKGWGMRVLFLVLLPIMLPLACGIFAYMIWLGKQQLAITRNMTLDATWVEQQRRSAAAAAAAAAAATKAKAGGLENLSSQAGCAPAPSSPALMPGNLGGNIKDAGKSLDFTFVNLQTPLAPVFDMAPGKQPEALQWMMQQLNSMTWTKVDVDVRHYHAHAAIMLRIPERYMDNRDCLDYLVNECLEL